MEEKEISNVGTITSELIGRFIIYGILFSIIYSGILSVFSTESLIFTAIIVIILQGITLFCTWRCCIAATFKKRLIDKKDIKIVMKNLIIFTIILWIITGLINFSSVSEELNEKINSNTYLMLSESYIKHYYDDNEFAKYQAEKEKIINQAKNELYTYVIVLEIGLLPIYLGMVPLQKKIIFKYAI